MRASTAIAQDASGDLNTNSSTVYAIPTNGFYAYDSNGNITSDGYTRGPDLSGTFQRAGGIGGLLARTAYGQELPGAPTTSFYHADGNGNITALVYPDQQLAAKYLYDPFGNMLVMSGPLMNFNKYRFSSKEWSDTFGLYYYGYRFYDPSLQRWANRDPLIDYGSTVYDQMPKDGSYRLFFRVGRQLNELEFVGNDPEQKVDLLGLQSWMGPGYGAIPFPVPSSPNPAPGSPECECERNGGKMMSVAEHDFGGDFNKCVDSLWNSTPPQSLPGGIQVIGILGGTAYPPVGLGLGLGSVVQYAMATLTCEGMHCYGASIPQPGQPFPNNAPNQFSSPPILGV